MDEITFDRMSKLLGTTPSRRITLNLVASAVFGGLTGLVGWDETDARKKKKGTKKKGKRKKGNRTPEGEFCGDEFCKPGQRCCGGECVEPSLCCVSSQDCNACSVCTVGLCVPDPAKNGTTCSGCLECANGACGIPNDDFCESDERCRTSTGICCRTCLNDQCCPVGSACVDPGLFSDNFCCDAELNEPCGDNGDGTFGECCAKTSERCVDGQCVPKDECPQGLAAQGLCCATEQQRCRRTNGEEYCCPEGKTCCALKDGTHVCCAPDRCLEPGLCCAPEAVVKCSGQFAHCAPPENQCCGEFSCPDCSRC